jgi:ribonuclease G
MVDCVELHTSDTPVFEAVGIQQGADRAFKDRVELPSGGYLFIERTEAMHVVDVNSGRSGRGKSQSQNSLDVNLEAARVIAQQIRLRDLGGIIVVDFIDLRDDKARKKVYDELQQGFEDDRAVTKILPMSDFGLVEITRQRLRPSITTTFSSANGESDEDEAQAPAKQQKKGKDTRSNDLEQQKREIRRLRQEVRRLKKEANAPQASNGENDADQPDIDPEEVQALRQRVQELEHEAEEAAAAAAAAKREGADGSDTPAAPDMQPEALIEAIEAWLDDYTTSGRRRAVTLHVHPFTAAFLNRPVPSYPTRWFMRHLVRVHVEADPDVPPMAFQCRDARSGEELRTTRAAKASA